MKVAKKIFICILSFILSFNLLCNDFIFVSASSVESTFIYPDNWDSMTETEKLSYFYQYAMEHDVAYEDVPAMYPYMDTLHYKFTEFLFCKLGMVLSGSPLASFSQLLWNLIPGQDTPLLDSKGYVSDDIMQELIKLLKDQQEATEIQYTFYTPPSISSVSSAHFIDLKHYDACKSLVTQYGGASNVHYLSSGAGRDMYVFDSSSFYYSINSPSIYDRLVTTGEMPTNAFLYPYTFNFVNAGNAGLVSSATYDSITCNYKITPFPQYFGFEPYNGLVSASGSPIMIFRTIEGLKRFLNLESNIYRGHSTYNGGGITVPAAALQYDYSKLYDTVSDNINNTDSPTPEDIRQIVDDAIQGALDEIGTPGSGSEEEEEKEPDSILGYLKSINDKLKKILDQVKQIKWLSVADLVDDIIFNLIDLKQDFEPVVQTMSRKFPFSIPWDTVLVFSLLADSPETPVFELPFVIESVGINEVMVVDLARFEKLSKVSRFMLTLTFLLMLFALTRKIASWFANR